MQWVALGSLALAFEAILGWLYMEMPPDLNLRDEFKWLSEKAFTWQVVQWIVGSIWAFGGLAVNEHLYTTAYILFASGGILLLGQLFNWVYKERPKGKRALMLTIFGGCIVTVTTGECFLTYNLQLQTSVLKMRAQLEGGYGPGAEFTKVDFAISNPGEDAIENMDFTVGTLSKMNIKAITELAPGTNDCKAAAVNLFPEATVTLSGPGDSRERFALNTREVSEAYIAHFGSARWKLTCPRLSGYSTTRFQVTVLKDVENDSMHVYGVYERIPSRGSSVVKVNNIVQIRK